MLNQDNEKHKQIIDSIIKNKYKIEKILGSLSFPLYFLDFESISRKEEDMKKYNLSCNPQISSFSILIVNDKKFNEDKIYHWNFININGKEKFSYKEDYLFVAKK